MRIDGKLLIMKKQSSSQFFTSVIPGRLWWVLALMMIVAFGLCPLVGIYTLANLITAGMAGYILFLASKRKKRLETNRELIGKMNAKNRKQFMELDARELANIHSLSKLASWIIWGCLFFDVYTYVYNLMNHKDAALISGLSPTLSMILFVTGLVFGILFYCSFKNRLNDLLIELPVKKR